MSNKTGQHGIIRCSMKTTNSTAVPAHPPQLIKTLVAGFDTTTNHIALIIFPIALDILIWLAPRLRLKEIIDRLVGELVSQSLAVAPDVQTGEMLNSAQSLWALAAEQFNMLVVLRSYPVGISSLMVSILPLKTPLGTPPFVEVVSFGSIFLIFLGLGIAGLILGTLYFSTVSQAAVTGEIRWYQAILDWPWLSWQVILLAVAWLILLVGVSIPASCMISVAALSNIAFAQCGVLLYGGFLIWIIFPLILSPHGIFIKKEKVWQSIKRSVYITRMTLPTTSLFFMSVLLITQGLDILWRIPPADTWLMLIGLAGHAFVTTGLLSASFIYYQDADKWLQSMQAAASVSNSGPDTEKV
jgi:hypothetical protein